MIYQGYEIAKSNSSYGNWSVWLNNVHVEFFWRKKDAIKFIDSHLADLARGERL